ncbi:MAG: hypothetical protein ACKOW8_11100, partial [Flavobacteriales bacterium]
DDAEIKKVKLEYDNAMKVLIESDMDYPQKLTRQYDLTLKYEKQLARLEQASAINGVNKETSAVKFVSSERGAVQVKLIAYKKELDRTQPSTQTDVAMSSTNSANSDRTEGAASNEGNIDANTTPSPSTDVGVSGADNASATQAIPASKSGQNDTDGSSPITNATSNPESINSANPNISNTAANSTYTEATQNVAGKTNNTSNSESNNMNSTKSESSPVVINESAVFLTKANSAREEAGDLWQEKATPSPQLLLSKPAQIGFSKVIASPQFKSMLYTSQSGKPIQRLNEYENNELEIESIDARMQAANGNLDTLRALDSRKNKLLSIQNKIEIENAEEYSRIVKRNYNDQRLATDKGMENLPSAARNRSVLSEAMLSKLRKADSLMVEAVILKSEAAWAYNEEEKADLFKMALAKQIQSIEMLRQVELMSVNSNELLTMSDAEIRAFARQTSGGVSTTALADNTSAPSTNSPLISENQDVTVTEGTANSNSNIGANTSEVNTFSGATQTSQNNADGNTTAVIETGASKTDSTENIKAVDGKNTTSSEEKINASAQPNDNTTKTQTVDSNPATASNAIQSQQNIAEGINTTERPENKDASAPVYIDPYAESAPENSNTAISTEAQHTLISEEKIPSSIEQKEMTRPEQAKWMISVLEEPEELPETEV